MMKNNEKQKAEIMGINRHRMGTDGKGISTLITFYGCPLNCKYCLNPQCKSESTPCTYIEPNDLVNLLMVDDIYFKSTGGGIVFGGGEPLLNAEYIKEVCDLVPLQWKIRIETSLNVKWDKIELLIPYIDQWIIDIKDSNTEIYKNYTGVDNLKVYDNVLRLSHKTGKEKLLIRIPKIPNYNTEKNIQESVKLYSNLGNIDVFKYRILNRNY
nr:radical SAM protein [uncultured Ruminococcus sp.]